MSLCWQQITFCAVALVLVLANVGTAQKRREKPSTTVSSGGGGGRKTVQTRIENSKSLLLSNSVGGSPAAGA